MDIGLRAVDELSPSPDRLETINDLLNLGKKNLKNRKIFVNIGSVILQFYENSPLQIAVHDKYYNPVMKFTVVGDNRCRVAVQSENKKYNTASIRHSKSVDFPFDAPLSEVRKNFPKDCVEAVIRELIGSKKRKNKERMAYACEGMAELFWIIFAPLGIPQDWLTNYLAQELSMENDSVKMFLFKRRSIHTSLLDSDMVRQVIDNIVLKFLNDDRIASNIKEVFKTDWDNNKQITFSRFDYFIEHYKCLEQGTDYVIPDDPKYICENLARVFVNIFSPFELSQAQLVHYLAEAMEMEDEAVKAFLFKRKRIHKSLLDIETLFRVLDKIFEQIWKDDRIDSVKKEAYKQNEKVNVQTIQTLFVLYLEPNDIFQNIKELRAFGINTLGELLAFVKSTMQAKEQHAFDLEMSTITLHAIDKTPVEIVLYNKLFDPLFACIFENDKCFVESANPDIHDQMTFSLDNSLCEVTEGLVKFSIKWSNIKIDYPY